MDLDHDDSDGEGGVALELYLRSPFCLLIKLLFYLTETLLFSAKALGSDRVLERACVATPRSEACHLTDALIDAWNLLRRLELYAILECWYRKDLLMNTLEDSMREPIMGENRGKGYIPLPNDPREYQELEWSDDDSIHVSPRQYRLEQIREFHIARVAARGEDGMPRLIILVLRRIILLTRLLGTNLAELQQYVSFETGELAPLGEEFTLFQLVKEFPWYHVGKRYQQKVSDLFALYKVQSQPSSAPSGGGGWYLDHIHRIRVGASTLQLDFVAINHFSNEKIFNYPWSFFYLHKLKSPNPSSPLILVLASQFEHYLQTINALGYKSRLSLPAGDAVEAYRAYFEDSSTPCPRYLGKAGDHSEFEDLKSYSIYPRTYQKPGEPATPTPTKESLEAFQSMLDTMLATQKAKAAASKAVAKKKRVELKSSWGRSVKRVQRYIGLRAKVEERADWVPATMKDPEFSADSLAPADMDFDVVFVCIDIEAWEDNNDIITEIGVSSLDTRDLATVPPGPNGTNWHKIIRARHFRIQEYASHTYVNRKHISGCPDSFLFGTTEIIPKSASTAYIASSFIEPFAKPIPGAKRTPDVNNLAQRNVVFVGHNTASDIKFLKKLGFDIFDVSNIIEHIDTAQMHQFLTRRPDTRKLVTVLAELDLAGWSAHNGGNDAVYTLQAMISLAIRDLTDKAKAKEKRKEQELAAKLQNEETVTNARAEAEEREEGVSSGDEGSDGGNPVKPYEIPIAKRDKYLNWPSEPFAPSWDHPSSQVPLAGLGGEEMNIGDDTNARPHSKVQKKSTAWEDESDDEAVYSAPAPADMGYPMNEVVEETRDFIQEADPTVGTTPGNLHQLTNLLKEQKQRQTTAWEEEPAVDEQLANDMANLSTVQNKTDRVSEWLSGNTSLGEEVTNPEASSGWYDPAGGPGGPYVLDGLQKKKKNRTMAWEDEL
ncbi:hypothetical protein HYALB_00010184 [Hymenoscyphus albidus]|uniref:Gfd2/YDR514C-like C-terminal domain-containing protein n=1 Tax=Hymenoscyphus albidus TaxID=595503 RepID=A0A9N9LF37_9HELO|nr:hypothetical protein HYALB_00010184 [Hymenoscyphus albidus]